MRPATRSMPLRTMTAEALNSYFETLNGHKPGQLYDLVLREVEEPLFKAVLDYAAGRLERTQGLGEYLATRVQEPASPTLHDEPFFLRAPFDLRRASGSRPLPGGQSQEPGGWNRVVLRVVDLPGCVAALKTVGVRFRNEMESGPAGRQIQVDDPDGNPIELFEPAR